MKIKSMINQIFKKKNKRNSTFRHILSLLVEDLGDQLYSNKAYTSFTILDMEEYFKNDYFQFLHDGIIYDLTEYNNRLELSKQQREDLDDFESECLLTISKENYKKRKAEFRQLGAEFRKEGFGVKLKFNSGLKNIKKHQQPGWSMIIRIDQINI